MEAEVAKVPKLFTRCPIERQSASCSVVCKIAPSGKGVAVTATTTDNASYSATFDEGALRKIAGGSSDWARIFAALSAAFVDCRCSASIGSENKVEICRLDVPGVGHFPLPADPRINGHSFLLDNMVSFVRMRAAKDPDKMLKDLTDKEQSTHHKAETLRQEEMQLVKALDESRERDAASRKKLAELEQQLGRLERDKKKAAVDAGEQEVEAEEDEAAAKVARTRDPLYGKDCKEVDKEVLRLVKSYYVQWDQPVAADQHWLEVVVPMRRDEFAQATQGMDDPHKQALFDLLKKIDEWDYDVFGLQEYMSGGHDPEGLREQRNGGALLITTYALLMRHGFLQKFNMREKIVLNWLSVIEAGYHPNPYHNSMHAADVLHITNFILCAGGLIQTCKLSDEDIFAAVFAAAIHDYNHPGINNNFHIKAQTYLAVLYNDRSVLENIHVSSVFELMKMDKFNVMEAFTEEQRRDIRETIIEMVLATDMGLHAKILGTFKRRLAEDHNFTKKDDIRLAMNMALKMADISNCGRPEGLYLKWCNKIADEFYMQGDRERNAGMQCSPFMDRYQPAMAKGQIAFMNYIVIPLFECVSEFLPEMHFSVDFTENNKAYWANNDDS